MSLSLGIFTFINVWWIMLFFVLPFGVRPTHNPSAVEYAAAPAQRNWKKTILINTILSFAVTIILALVIKSGIVPLHDMLGTL